MAVIYCEICERELERETGICEECVSDIELGIINPEEYGW